MLITKEELKDIEEKFSKLKPLVEDINHGKLRQLKKKSKYIDIVKKVKEE